MWQTKTFNAESSAREWMEEHENRYVMELSFIENGCQVEYKPFHVIKWDDDTEEDNESCLEYLRGEILAERISYGEIAELQSLAKFIPADDTLLLEWAGVEEKFD